MNELKIHNDERGHPVDLHLDQKVFPLAAYLVLAAIPSDQPGVQCLTFGNSDTVGRMLMTYYERCVIEQPEMAHVLEQVARGIVGMAESFRGKWVGEDMTPPTTC